MIFPSDIQLLLNMFMLVYIGWAIRGYFARRDIEAAVNQMIEDGIISVNDDEEDGEEGMTVVSIRVEMINSIAYIYNSESNEFMFQVKTKDEFAEHMHSWSSRNNVEPSRVSVIVDEQSSKLLESLS